MVDKQMQFFTIHDPMDPKDMKNIRIVAPDNEPKGACDPPMVDCEDCRYITNEDADLAWQFNVGKLAQTFCAANLFNWKLIVRTCCNFGGSFRKKGLCKSNSRCRENESKNKLERLCQ